MRERVRRWGRPDRWDALVALAVFAAALAALMATMSETGITRDESFYFHAARDYIGWFRELEANWEAGRLGESFGRTSVDRHWSYNPEHPVLMKTLFALSHELFHIKLGWLSNATAWRLPGAAFAAGLVALVYLFGRQLVGRGAGLISAGTLLLQPRFFFHGHMAGFDVAISAVWFAVVYTYWRSLERGSGAGARWAVACGLLWGLGLATKLNAFFLPIVLLLHWALTRWHGLSLGRDEGRGGVLSVRLPGLPWALVAMALLGPVVFYATWPRIWFDTAARVGWYIKFHAEHVHYFVQYFGEPLVRPPFPASFPWVMTLVTVPATVLLAAALGVWALASEGGRLRAWTARWRRALAARSLREASVEEVDRRGTVVLLALNLLFPIALIAMPSTPVFGGTKHWMPAMPYLALLAGVGASWAAARLAPPRAGGWRPAAAGLAMGAAVLLPAGVATAGHYRFGTSYYNELIGGVRGAADAGMMRQFWGYASRQALGWLGERAPQRARVWPHNTTGWAFQDYKRDGLLREDVRWVGGGQESSLALYHHQRAFVYLLVGLWQEYGTMAPAHVVELEGVPMLSVYRRPPATAAAADRQ